MIDSLKYLIEMLEVAFELITAFLREQRFRPDMF